jgi:Acylphosphatase
MTSETKIVRVTIGGYVQGVGYRAWLEREARAGGVIGPLGLPQPRQEIAAIPDQ